jgi:hypothetical protein
MILSRQWAGANLFLSYIRRRLLLFPYSSFPYIRRKLIGDIPRHHPGPFFCPPTLTRYIDPRTTWYMFCFGHPPELARRAALAASLQHVHYAPSLLLPTPKSSSTDRTMYLLYYYSSITTLPLHVTRPEKLSQRNCHGLTSQGQNYNKFRTEKTKRQFNQLKTTLIPNPLASFGVFALTGEVGAPLRPALLSG